MTREISVITPDDPIVEAARRMAEKKISCLVVTLDERIQGILTETDLLRKVVGRSETLGKKVREVMTFPVQGVDIHTSIFEASKTMKAAQIKHLPVLENGRLAGIVTQTDLTRALASYEMWRSVEEIMTREVLTASWGTSVAEAARLMSERGVSCIVVKVNDAAAGIFTTRDLAQKIIANGIDAAAVPIEKVMSSPVEMVSHDTSVLNAVKIMEAKKIRRVIVHRDGKLCGIATQTDVFRAIGSKIEDDERRNRALLEASDLGIYTLDLENRITYVNPALMRLLEVEKPSELIGNVFLPERFWQDPVERKEFHQFLRDCNKAHVAEVPLKTARNRPVFVTFFVTAVRNSRGEITGRQGFFHDITEKKELVTVKEAERVLREHNELLRSVNELKSNIIELVAHDLKTPLSINMAEIERLLDGSAGSLSEKQSEILVRMGRSVERLIRLIHDLLDASRLESGKMELNKSTVDLVGLVKKVIESFASMAGSKGLALELDAVMPVLEVTADGDRLAQVWINLVGNAIKFTPSGKVTLSIVDKGGEVECSVADTGPGIPADQRGRLFEQFQKLGHQASGTSEKGTGLGLSIAKGLVGLHGGRIWVESEEGRGTRFFFTLSK